MKAKVLVPFVGLLLGGVLVAGSANAASLSLGDTLSWTQTDLFDKVLSVGLFDNSVGSAQEGAILTSVNITLTGSMWTGDGEPSSGLPVRLENSSADSADSVFFQMVGNYSATVFGGVTGLTGLDFDNNNDLYISATGSGFGEQLIKYSGPIAAGETVLLEEGGFNVEGDGLFSKTVSTTITGSDLASFIGTGTFGYTLDAIAASNSAGAGNLDTFVNTYATGSLSVTYNYTPYEPPVDPPSEVPEPTTMLLFGTGLVGLAGIGRRRVSKK